MARSVLGVATWDQIEAAAVAALQDGLDSYRLRLLAGLDSAHASEAKDLLVATFDELGLNIPEQREAVFELSRKIASDIVNGEVVPYEGAKELAQLSGIPDDRVRELDPFVYSEDEWMARPEDREFFDWKIVEEAKHFLDGLE